MSDNLQEIVLKLTIDNKEYQATIDVSKGKLIELTRLIDPLENKFENAYKKITAELSKYNIANEKSINDLTEWIRTQDLSIATIEQAIKRIQEETKALSVNTPEWVKSMAAVENLNTAKSQLITQYDSYNSAQKKVIPGQNLMNMALSQFGFAIGDASMLLVNFRLGLAGIGNNLPFLVQYFNEARRAAGENTSALQLLVNSIKGGGGLIIAINGLMLLMQLLPGLFDASTESMNNQREMIKKLADEYKRLSITELDAERQSLEKRKAAIEAQIEEINNRKETIKVPSTQRGAPPTIITKFKYEEDEIRYKQLTEGVGSGDERVPGLNEINNQLRKLDEIASASRQKLESILSGSYDLSSINNIRNAIEILNREIDAATSETDRAPLRKLKDTLENTLKLMSGDKGKEIESFSKSLSKSIEQIFKDELLHAAELELAGQDYFEILSTYEAAQDSYNTHLKSFHLIKNQTELDGWNFTKDVMEKNLEMMKKKLEEEEKVMDEAAKKALANRKRSAEAQDKWLADKQKFESESGYRYESDPFKQQIKELEAEEEASIQRAEMYAATEEQITNIKSYYAQRRNEIEAQQSIAQLSIWQQTLSNLGGLFGKHTTAYKLLSMAVVGIEAGKQMAAALSPPPVGLGPVWGYTLWPFITANAIAQSASINAINTKGFAEGGILPQGKIGFFEGLHDEIVAPKDNFISVVNDLVRQTQISMAPVYASGNNNSDLIKKIDLLNENIERLATRPARAYLDNDEAMKIGDHYDYETRRSIG